MPTAANVDSGSKDAKNRTIWIGPKGGRFVRVNGKKAKPSVAAKKPARSAPAPTSTRPWISEAGVKKLERDVLAEGLSMTPAARKYVIKALQPFYKSSNKKLAMGRTATDIIKMMTIDDGDLSRELLKIKGGRHELKDLMTVLANELIFDAENEKIRKMNASSQISEETVRSVATSRSWVKILTA